MKNKINKRKSGASSMEHPRGSYGSYGSSSASNMAGAINEFEDNLSVDWDDDPSDKTETTSVTNRIKPHSHPEKGKDPEVDF